MKMGLDFLTMVVYHHCMTDRKDTINKDYSDISPWGNLYSIWSNSKNLIGLSANLPSVD